MSSPNPLPRPGHGPTGAAGGGFGGDVRFGFPPAGDGAVGDGSSEELKVDAEAEAEAASDEGAEAASAPWPPRPAAVPVDPRFVQRELKLDGASAQIAPPPAPDFTPSKLARKPLPVGRAGVGPERGSVVAYDKRYAIGRSRWTEIFDADDRDYERRRQTLAREGALLGGAALVFVTLSLNPFGWVLLASGGAGAIAGAIAATRSDSVWAWSIAIGVAGFVLLAFMNPFLWFIAEGECLLIGWLAGFTREARH